MFDTLTFDKVFTPEDQNQKLYARLQLWFDAELGAYTVTFIVHARKRVVIDWTKGKTKAKEIVGNSLTGLPTMEALKWAKDTLVEVYPTLRAPLFISGSDQKRHRAYRRITKDLPLREGSVYHPYFQERWVGYHNLYNVDSVFY